MYMYVYVSRWPWKSPIINYCKPLLWRALTITIQHIFHWDDTICDLISLPSPHFRIAWPYFIFANIYIYTYVVEHNIFKLVVMFYDLKIRWIEEKHIIPRPLSRSRSIIIPYHTHGVTFYNKFSLSLTPSGFKFWSETFIMVHLNHTHLRLWIWNQNGEKNHPTDIFSHISQKRLLSIDQQNGSYFKSLITSWT